MWCFCDDGGVHPASAARLKMEVFPADAIAIEAVRALAQELIDQALLEEFEVDGKGYWRVTGWHHQRIEKPTYSYPRSQEFGEASASTRRLLYDQAATSRREVAEPPPPESKGDESSRVESSRKETKSAGGPPANVGDANSPDCEYPTFPCIAGKTTQAKTWQLEQDYLAELSKAFPGVDVPQECIKAHTWVKASGENRKTAAGMKEFLFRWMTREQNSGRRSAPRGAAQQQRRPVTSISKPEGSA
jgi:hypothetical protein